MSFAAPTVEEHLTALTASVSRFAADAVSAGLATPVPTCPGWTVLDLVAHQGMVHRWATAVVQGQDPRSVDDAALEAQGREHPDPTQWLRRGADDLVAALREAPDDLDVMTFLHDAPPARRFWARRQCHETTVHALDARTSATGLALRATDVAIDEALAADGVDELLVGFWQRRRKGPRSEHPYTAVVSVTGGPAWLLDVGPEHPVTRRLEAVHALAGIPPGPRRLSGSAADLYLALWNRGGSPEDPTGLLDEWRVAGGAVR